MQSRSDWIYLTLATTFAVTLVLSNVIASKLLYVPWMPGDTLPAGLLTYPLTFLMTDLIAEVWGARHARFVVYLAFAMNLLMVGITQMALHIAPSPAWDIPGNPFGYSGPTEFQNAYASVFGLSYKLVIGSMASYLIAQLLDVWLFDRIKIATGGKHLWLRNNASTLSSQMVDTAIVGYAFFFWALGMPAAEAIPIMLGSYAFKVVFALCDTPFLYLSVALVKRAIKEGNP